MRNVSLHESLQGSVLCVAVQGSDVRLCPTVRSRRRVVGLSENGQTFAYRLPRTPQMGTGICRRNCRCSRTSRATPSDLALGGQPRCSNASERFGRAYRSIANSLCRARHLGFLRQLACNLTPKSRGTHRQRRFARWLAPLIWNVSPHMAAYPALSFGTPSAGWLPVR